MTHLLFRIPIELKIYKRKQTKCDLVCDLETLKSKTLFFLKQQYKMLKFMKSSDVIFLIMVVFCSSCSGRSNEKEGTLQSTSSVNNVTNATCVFDYMDKYDQLLPLEVIQKHYTGDMSFAKMKYNKSKKAESQNHDSYIYSWPSDRFTVKNFGGGDMKIPLQNEIGIVWLGDDLYKIMGLKTPMESFKKFYRTPSNEELEAAFGKAEEKIANDKNIDKETKETASSMAKGIAKGVSYTDVTGFGDAASWDARDNNLIILIGDKTFKVRANVSADSETNKALAMKLATEVLAKCK